jgi:hypothetical protein
MQIYIAAATRSRTIMSNEDKESTEEERVEAAKKINSDYSPAGNTEEICHEDKSKSKSDEYGKRKRNVEGDKKANPSS